MGVTAELEVNTGLPGLLQMVGLMIQQYAESTDAVGKCAERLAVRVGTVITSYNGKAAKLSRLVPQQTDAGILEELLHQRLACVVVMIAQHGPDRGFKPVELLRIITFNNRTDAAVNNITGSKDKVRILGIDHVHPSGQLGATVMVAQMQVTYKDHLERLVKWFIGRDGKFFTILMVIVKSAYKHEQDHASYDCAEPLRAALKEIGREQAAYLCNTGKKKTQKQVQEKYEPWVAHIIYYLSQPQRQPLYPDKTDKEKSHPSQKRQQHSGLYRPHPGGDTPKPQAQVYIQAQDNPYKQQCNCLIHRRKDTPFFYTFMTQFSFPTKMTKRNKPLSWLCVALSCCAAMMTSCSGQANNSEKELMTVGNPYLPLWEHIPDGEPYVFEDPDNPGKQRVYIYGSHDSRVVDYCGRELVLWSAPVEDLSHWRYDGEILKVDKNAAGQSLTRSGLADVLFAPDITLVTAPDGTKTYYLYPNDQAGGRNGLIAKSSRPDGPFEVCNWSKENPNSAEGVLAFDPAVFVDDDGKIYGYWGFERSYAAELDPATMATVKPGTKIVEDMVPGRYMDGVFKFFEASSIRKIQDKYIFIYSRFTLDGEFGLPSSNYTLAYAYSDNPLGPWTYGGTVIDGRGREVNEQGEPFASATVDGNTHGGICEINGQWYVFYHRHTGTDEYARQAMVAPITVKVTPGPGGKVEISEGEYNSEGFALNGLDPLERHSAGIACWYSGPRTAIHDWPNNTFFGSYVASTYGTDTKFDAPYEIENNTNPIVNNTDGSIVGYKYFNFDGTCGRKNVKLQLNLIPEGVDGTITVMVDRPWESQGGKELGKIQLKAGMAQKATELSVKLPGLAELSGKHAIYFTFSSGTKEKSICTLLDLKFQ